MNVKEYDEVTAYSKVLSMLYRNDEVLRHPRTHELIFSCTDDKLPKPSTKYLLNCPRVRYHQKLNQEVSRMFKDTLQLRMWCRGSTIIQPRLITQKAIPTYKTIWYSKGTRRS